MRFYGLVLLEQLALKVAMRLPRRVKYWVLIQELAAITATDELRNKEVGTITIEEVLNADTKDT